MVDRQNITTLFAMYSVGSGLAVAAAWLISELRGLPSTPVAIAISIGFVGLWPTVVTLATGDNSRFPYLALVGLYYAAAYGFSFFVPGVADYPDPSWNEDTQIRAMGLALIGVTLLLAAYGFASRYLIDEQLCIRVPSRRLGLISLQTLGVIALSVNTLALAWPPLQDVPTLGILANGLLGFVGYAVLYALWLEGESSVSAKILIWGVFVPLNLGLRLMTGLLSQVLIIALMLATLHWRMKGRVPWRLTLVGVLLFIALSPIKESYRQAIQFGVRGQGEASLSERLAVAYGLARTYVDVVTRYEGEVQAATGVRLNDTVTLAKVMEDTPSIVPYWSGETYLPLLTKLVPRFLWEDKPMENIGNQFGHRYGYLAADDDITAYNLPWIVEMYANFGIFGVLIGMTLAGFAVALVDRLLNPRSWRVEDMVFSSSVLIGIVHHESNFSGQIGGIPYSVLAVLGLLIIARKARSSSPAKRCWLAPAPS